MSRLAPCSPWFIAALQRLPSDFRPSNRLLSACLVWVTHQTATKHAELQWLKMALPQFGKSRQHFDFTSFVPWSPYVCCPARRPFERQADQFKAIPHAEERIDQSTDGSLDHQRTKRRKASKSSRLPDLDQESLHCPERRRVNSMSATIEYHASCEFCQSEWSEEYSLGQIECAHGLKENTTRSWNPLRLHRPLQSLPYVPVRVRVGAAQA